MARDSSISLEDFEEMLAWLDPDREVAATLYLQLREDLANILKWKGSTDPEGLTDEVFERVARKVHEVRPTYEGDPRLYFRAVANNVAKEDLKKAKTRVPLEGRDLPQQKTTEIDEETVAVEECLQSCLEKLSTENRKLIVAYYVKEKQAKIDSRSELARQLQTSVETLRVRVYRIRKSLRQCIERCLKHKAQEK
jgi:RNA polymerase sigma factor (sigma-70 family)